MRHHISNSNIAHARLKQQWKKYTQATFSVHKAPVPKRKQEIGDDLGVCLQNLQDT